MDAHGIGDLKSFIKTLNYTDLQALFDAINTYFQGRWYTFRKESTFAKAVKDLDIGYNPSEKITRKEIEELRDIVTTQLEEQGLSTDNGTDTMSQDSTARRLDFASDTNSTQDSTETEAGTSSKSPINVTNLNEQELRSIQAKIDEYERSTSFRKESRFAANVNALNIDGVKFDMSWLASTPKKEEIAALKHAVQAQLEQFAEVPEDQTISSQADSDNEELAVIDSGLNSPHIETAPETLTNQPDATTGNAPAASPKATTSNDGQINVDALIANASATGTLAEKTADASTPPTQTENEKGFTGKQYAAAGTLGGLLSMALLSPEIRSGQNPLKILLSLLPFMTKARVKTLTRAQKIALGRLVTAAIVGTAGVGSMGYGAYKMYKTNKTA